MRQTELYRLVAEQSGESILAIESRGFSLDLADISGVLEE
jgi:hypothetical protein